LSRGFGLQSKKIRGYDEWNRTYNIGLRTLKVNWDKDEWSEAFAVEVNQKAFFGMGANYISMDNIIYPKDLDALLYTSQLLLACSFMGEH
jgi:hypothetical protein